MFVLVALFGFLIAAIGTLGVASPGQVVAAMERLEPRTRFTVAVGVRLVLGIVLVLAAPDSRFPTALYTLGIIALIVALLFVPMGVERVDSLVRWWLEKPAAFLRSWFVVGIAFGAFLVYASL
jgi:hypothetical protein